MNHVHVFIIGIALSNGNTCSELSVSTHYSIRIYNALAQGFMNRLSEDLEQQAHTIFSYMFPHINYGNNSIGDVIVPKRGKALLSKDTINGAAPKYDIRDWAPEHEKMGKGVTLTEEEIESLRKLL